MQKQDLLQSLLLTLLTRLLLIWKKVRNIIYKPASFTQRLLFEWFSVNILFTLSANIDPSRRYLYLQVLGGKAFLEHLQEPEPLPGQVCSTFTLYLHFRNQRFRSKPVPCACEPALTEGFLLEIHRDGIGMCK